MSRPTHQAPQEMHQTIQTIRIEELVHDNADLTLQLQDADTEIATLKVKIAKLQNGQIALTAKLEDENNEIGRLTMVINRHHKSMEKLFPPKKSS